VAYPIGTAGGDSCTCGMHLLGAPDLIVSDQVLKQTARARQSTASAAAELFQIFGLYLLSECPIGRFASGHTFCVAADAPRYRVVWEPCTGYGEDDFFFNPFGRWRFELA
jgi:hypothetical protein